MNPEDISPLAALALPIDINLPGDRPGRITALRETTQVPEATGDVCPGWIVVPDGYVLTECIYDIASEQSGCFVRLALDPAGDIVAQVEAAIAAC